MASVKPSTYSKVGMRALRLRLYTMSRSISWLYMLGPPLKNNAKKLVNVSTPRPPIWMRSDSTRSPRGVNVADMSTGVRPVIHTADVLTKSEST